MTLVNSLEIQDAYLIDNSLSHSQNEIFNALMFAGICVTEQADAADLEVIRLIEKRFFNSDKDIDEKNSYGATLLHFAAEFGRVRVVQKLIELNANVDALDDSGESPIFAAARIGGVDALDELIRSNADLSIRCYFREKSPLHMAVLNNQIKTIEKLYELGFDLNEETGYGETPLTICVDEGYVNGLIKLLELGAKPTIEGQFYLDYVVSHSSLRNDLGIDDPMDYLKVIRQRGLSYGYAEQIIQYAKDYYHQEIEFENLEPTLVFNGSLYSARNILIMIDNYLKGPDIDVASIDSVVKNISNMSLAFLCLDDQIKPLIIQLLFLLNPDQFACVSPFITLQELSEDFLSNPGYTSEYLRSTTTEQKLAYLNRLEEDLKKMEKASSDMDYIDNIDALRKEKARICFKLKSTFDQTEQALSKKIMKKEVQTEIRERLDFLRGKIAKILPELEKKWAEKEQILTVPEKPVDFITAEELTDPLYLVLDGIIIGSPLNRSTWIRFLQEDKMSIQEPFSRRNALWSDLKTPNEIKALQIDLEVLKEEVEVSEDRKRKRGGESSSEVDRKRKK